MSTSNTPQDAPAEESADLSANYAARDEWLSEPVTESYADTLNVNVGTYGMSITFGIQRGGAPAPKARIHMSHQLAMVLQRLLTRTIMETEKNQGFPILVDPNVLGNLKLTDDDMEIMRIEREQRRK